MSVEYKSSGPFGNLPLETDDVYHANQAISKSKLCDFLDSPEFFRQKHILKMVGDEDTQAKSDGRAFHHLMRFGTKRFNADYPVEPDFGHCRKTDSTSSEQAKENKLKRDLWRSENGACIETIDAEKNAMFIAMHQSVCEHPAALDLISDGRHEETWRITPAHLPFTVQCRPDLFNPNGCKTSGGKPYIADFKSIANISRGEDPKFLWEREFTQRRYFIQDPFYQSVLGLLGAPVDDMEFYFIVTEKNHPHATAVFTASEEARGTGRKIIRTAITQLAECLSSGIWPSTPRTVQTCSIPEWLQTKAFK